MAKKTPEAYLLPIEPGFDQLVKVVNCRVAPEVQIDRQFGVLDSARDPQPQIIVQSKLVAFILF